MKKLFFSLSLILLLGSATYGQQKNASISFEKSVHNFGEIKEADGTVTYRFEFTNTGNEPLLVQKVSSSCGCTTPEWTKQPVMPGEKGFVSAAFNPAHRPGKFNKSITVMTNSSTPSVRLRITGNVIPKPLSIEEQYRYSMGNIRLKSNHVSFGTVYKGQSRTKMLELVNTSNETVDLEFRNIPAHIKASIPKNNLKPGATGFIEFTYLSENKNDWDFVIDRIPLYINGETDRNQRIIISANIQEDFSGLSAEEKAKAPSIEFENKTLNFDQLKQGEKIEHNYVFTNKGKSDLVIRKVRASCGCTAIITENKVVKPGEQGKIRVTFNSAGKLGKQNKTVTVISNDPDHNREILWIRGEVVK